MGRGARPLGNGLEGRRAPRGRLRGKGFARRRIGGAGRYGKGTGMAIVVNLYYTGRDGSARAFAAEMESAGVADRIRAEQGNICYRYFQPLDDPETVLLIDAWEDQEAIDAHHASAMMRELAALRDKYDLHMKAERYVTDEAGFSAHDASFLRP